MAESDALADNLRGRDRPTTGARNMLRPGGETHDDFDIARLTGLLAAALSARIPASQGEDRRSSWQAAITTEAVIGDLEGRHRAIQKIARAERNARAVAAQALVAARASATKSWRGAGERARARHTSGGARLRRPGRDCGAGAGEAGGTWRSRRRRGTRHTPGSRRRLRRRWGLDRGWQVHQQV